VVTRRKPGRAGSAGAMVFRQMVPRSASRVAKLCTGRSPGVCLVAALARARGERAAGATGLDLAQVSLGGGEQRFPLAGPLGFQVRVHAGHQPLAGEVRAGDLGQVLDIEHRQLQVPVPDQRLDLRGAQRSDPWKPLGSRCGSWSIASSTRGFAMPQVGTPPAISRFAEPLQDQNERLTAELPAGLAGRAGEV
jgi:hypothetical protein